MTAFEVTGGVPWRHIRYDNLSPAVAKVLTGRNRTETARWSAFRSWYGVEPFYCERGLSGAHEKGGVEGEIGRYRRRWMVPVPRVASLAELNAKLAEADVADDHRHIESRAASVATDFAAEQRFLGPLPGDGFDTGTVLWPRADKFARISVGKCRYSVPARLIGQRVRIRLTANELEVFDGSRKAATHPRPAPSTWTWITTWRSCCASRARCPDRCRWRRPGRRARSPRRTSSCGTPRGPGWVTGPAPGR